MTRRVIASFDVQDNGRLMRTPYTEAPDYIRWAAEKEALIPLWKAFVSAACRLNPPSDEESV